MILISAMAMTLGGCLARTAVDVVSLPVHVAGKGVDWATTSQSEADRNRGREMRKEEARMKRERRREEEKQARHDRDMRRYQQ